MKYEHEYKLYLLTFAAHLAQNADVARVPPSSVIGNVPSLTECVAVATAVHGARTGSPMEYISFETRLEAMVDSRGGSK